MTPLAEAISLLAVPSAALQRQLDAYADLLLFYNRRINLIARTDEAYVRDHHIAHCLCLATRTFPTGSRVVDWGTGGGLPLIPLAMVFPETPFIGVDAVGKKVNAVAQMARALGLANVEVWHGRAESFSSAHTHSVSRATAPLESLWHWHRANAQPLTHTADDWPPGLICLKGGDLTSESQPLLAQGARLSRHRVPLADSHYHDKYVVTVQDQYVQAERSEGDEIY